VLVQIDALLFEVGDRLPTARSTRLEIDVDVLVHRLRINMTKNERAGLAKMGRVFRAAESGRRGGGSFLESENCRNGRGRGMLGRFTSDAMISLEF
jgi:hypothetical protein